MARPLDSHKAELASLRHTMTHRPLTGAEFRRMVVLAQITGERLL